MDSSRLYASLGGRLARFQTVLRHLPFALGQNRPSETAWLIEISASRNG